MPHRAEPKFRALDTGESREILSRNHVGRIAYSFHDRVDVEPIHYVYDRGWVYGRTSPGTKLATLSHHRWVAFEVDEVEGPFDWRSVVAHGAVYLLTASDSHTSPEEFQEALSLLRRFVPTTLTDDDPTPFRTVLFRLSVSEITGRCASTSPSGQPQHESTSGDGHSAVRQ